jgi:hypothetical protein
LILRAAGGNPGRYKARLVVKLDSGKKYSRQFHFFIPLTGVKTSGTIAVDGNLADWAPATPAVIGKGQSHPVVFSQDCRAEVRFQWDGKALYVAADVEDDIFNQDRTDTNAYAQDSLNILVDAHNDAAVDPTPVKIRHGWGPNDHDFLVALTPDRTRVWRWTDVGVMYFKGKVEPAVSAAAVRNGLNTVYELAIPWTALSDIQPQPGKVLGIDVALNDADQGGTRESLGLGQAICGNAYRRPHNCADLILTETDGRAEAIADSILMTDTFPMD